MKKIDFLMTGEGVTDYGQKDFKSGTWIEGPAAVLVRKCAEDISAEISLSFADRRDVEKVRLGPRQLKGLQGKAVPARRFYVHMRGSGFQHGIYYCDADRDSGAKNTEHQAIVRFQKVYDEVDQGANPEEGKRHILPMVALRMIESWLLSDKEALLFSESGKKKLPKNIQFPANPEMLWGDKKDPNSDYPKNHLYRLYEKLHKAKPGRDEYITIARESDINVLSEKCPISFWKFRRDFTEYVYTQS